jgi:hypothetical protein
MFFSIDGGLSRISSPSTSQEARHQLFLALMVGAPGSIASEPPRWTARRRRFLALVVGAFGSSALAPLRGPTVDIF